LLQYECIDPDKEPQRARSMGVESYGEVIVLSGDRREKIKGYPSEAQLTNAILKVVSKEKIVLYFSTGHGESDLDGDNRMGLSFLKSALEIDNYDVRTIELMRIEEVPSDAACLIIVQPLTDLFSEEEALVEKYVASGGSLIVLAEHTVAGSVKNFLSDTYGIGISDTIIIDKMSQLFGAGADTAVVSQYGAHPITEGFNVASFFPTASRVDIQSSLIAESVGIAYSGVGSWAESSLEQLAEGQVTYNEGVDTLGPLSLGVVAEILPVSEGENEEAVKGKVIVFGDADFITNATLKLSGNRDLFLNSLAWAVGDNDLITIRNNSVEATPLFLSGSQGRILYILSLVVVPAIFFSLAIVVFIKRRTS